MPPLQQEEKVEVPKQPPQAVFKSQTVPAGTEFKASCNIIKSWTVTNNGLVAWPANSKLIFLRGDRELSTMEEFPVAPAAPLETVDVMAVLVAPPVPGHYTAVFQLADDQRTVFGPRLTVEINSVQPVVEPVVEDVMAVEDVKDQAAEDAEELAAVEPTPTPLAVPVPIPERPIPMV